MAGAVRGLSARLRDVSGLLAERFGRPGLCAHETEPVRNLVLTILSQNTTDANRDRAYDRLMRRFPTLSALAAARTSEVEEAIRVGGLARAKAKSILAALARIKGERGGYSLDFLREMPLPEARAYLISFPGVGVKTANILLLFSFGMPAFPVDTHVLRVTKRLGLVPGASDLAKAALSLEPHVEIGEHGPLHLNLIRLGREVCRPRNPLCPECPLLPVCPEGRRNMKGKGRRPTPPRASRRWGTPDGSSPRGSRSFAPLGYPRSRKNGGHPTPGRTTLPGVPRRRKNGGHA
jgi:endonuclease-3